MIKRKSCKICRKRFTPDPRVGDRQKTCRSRECQRELHKRTCKQWNNDNKNYFRANYLQNKIEKLKKSESDESDNMIKKHNADPERLLFEFQEEISAKVIVIIMYFSKLHEKRFQEKILPQYIEIKDKIDKICARGV